MVETFLGILEAFFSFDEFVAEESDESETVFTTSLALVDITGVSAVAKLLVKISTPQHQPLLPHNTRHCFSKGTEPRLNLNG